MYARFFLKNLLFISVLCAPLGFSALQDVSVSLAWGPTSKTLSFFVLWGGFVLLFWCMWLVYKMLIALLCWIFGIHNESALLTKAFIYLDGEDDAHLDRLLKQRWMKRTPFGAILDVMRHKKKNSIAYREALTRASVFEALQKWALRQKVRQELFCGNTKRGYELLKALYENHDHSPWTLKTLVQNALHHNDVDLVQQVLYTMKKRRIFPNDRLKWEGELLLKKAILWQGSSKKKEWLLEKALVLLPEEDSAMAELIALYIQDDDFKKAEDILASSWRLRPSQKLVPLFCKIYERKTKTERYEHVKKIVNEQQDHPLSLLLLGTCAFKAELRPVVLECSEKLVPLKPEWALFLKGLLRYNENKSDSLQLMKQGMGVMDTALKDLMEGLRF